MELHKFHGGLKLETHKTITDETVAIRHPLPARIILPLRQHIGIPSEPIVKVGDHVLKGQTIARANSYVSIPLHASTSGKVMDIGNYPVPHPAELSATCIVIEPDGNDKWCDINPVHEYALIDPKKLQEVIRDCGITGLGGAGFPAHVKLNEGVLNVVDTLIINGVECEPFITCDDRLIREKAHDVVVGTQMICHAVQAKHCVIAIEDDMPEAYEALAKFVSDDIDLIKVPARYPAGSEKQLIQVITNKEVPSGGLAIQIGIVMHNVATAASVCRAVTRGEPVISRYVTITGKVGIPRNLQVLLGTPVIDCLKSCGYEPSDNHRIILGGSMMGMHVTNPEIPIIKTTNCILVEKKKPVATEMPCIRCGACVDVCPIKLLPQQLYWHARSDNLEEVQRYHIFDCIECGCCSYVCPSHIPLVQYYRYAKSQIASEEQRRDSADHAKTRFMAHEARHDQKQQTATDDLPLLADPESDIQVKKDYIHAAVKRTREKYHKQQADPKNDSGK